MDDLSNETLPSLLKAQAARFGKRVALRKKEHGIWHDLSWLDYLDNVRWVFAALQRLGHRRGECVAIISENRPEWLYVDLGTQVAGGISVGVYTTNAAEQVAYVVRHSGARIFVVENEEQLEKVFEARDQLPQLERVIVIDPEGLRDLDDPLVMFYEDFVNTGRDAVDEQPNQFDESVAALDPHDTALLVYTSGTTGPPKGAMLTHRNLIWTAGSLGEANPLYDSDEVLSFLPLCHIAERMMTVVNQLRFGYTVSFAESLETVSDNLREISPTVFFAVPRIWEKFHSRIELTMDNATWFKRQVYRMAMAVGRHQVTQWFGPSQSGNEEDAQRRGRDSNGDGQGYGHRNLAFRLAHHAVLHPLRKRLGLERTRVAISGAAPISPEVLRYFHGVGIPLREVYGQTEGTGPTTIHAGKSIRLGTVGQALPGVTVKIAEDGEIVFRGNNVFKGYYKNDEATAETIIGGWLHSGDIGVIDQDGFLRITDRKKDLIITAGGKNLAPQNIENQLKFSPYINDAVAIGDRRKYVTALILIDEENVAKYAQDNRIPFTTYADLARNPEIRRLIDAEIKRVNQQLAQVEQVKRFAILEKRLDQEDGELTPTMKVKRQKICEQYADLIESLYKK